MAGAERFDVAVAGGGPAGIAAALAAAAAGARTLLLERDGRLGGNATHALVHTICGLYPLADEAGEPAAEVAPVHPGLPARLAGALRRGGGAGAPEAAGRARYLPMEPPAFAALAERACGKAAGLAVRTRTALVAARHGGDAWRLRAAGPDGEAELAAALLVDTSGDAAAGHLAGADTGMEPPGRLQRPSFLFRLADVDDASIEGFARLQLSAAVARAARRGGLPPECESLVVRPAGEPGALYATLTLPPLPDAPYAPLDPAHLAELARRARGQAEAVVAFLRATRPGFARARVAAWPARVGVRETRRLLGRAVLAREDVLAGRRRPDEVALSTWPIELWEDHRRPRLEWPAGPCSVPLDALVSRTHPHLGVAGRCLSASHEALGALRVIGTALATGEAVGVAAALAADAGASLADVAPERVRARLAAQAEGYAFP